MKSNGQARPGTRSKPITDGVDQPWGGHTGETVTLKSAEDSPMPDSGFIPSREEKIAIIAYYKAERRGFATSGELGDWLEAEREVDREKLEAANAGRNGAS